METSDGGPGLRGQQVGACVWRPRAQRRTQARSTGMRAPRPCEVLAGGTLAQLASGAHGRRTRLACMRRWACRSRNAFRSQAVLAPNSGHPLQEHAGYALRARASGTPSEHARGTKFVHLGRRPLGSAFATRQSAGCAWTHVQPCRRLAGLFRCRIACPECVPVCPACPPRAAGYVASADP